MEDWCKAAHGGLGFQGRGCVLGAECGCCVFTRTYDVRVLVRQTDVDVRVIKAAVDTAEELFYLPDRQRMLSRLKSVAKGKYLGVFMTKVDDARAAKMLKRREVESPPRDPLLWSGSLWTLDSTHAHDRWIREVVSGLLPYTGNTALKLCHRLVRERGSPRGVGVTRRARALAPLRVSCVHSRR